MQWTGTCSGAAQLGAHQQLPPNADKQHCTAFVSQLLAHNLHYAAQPSRPGHVLCSLSTALGQLYIQSKLHVQVVMDNSQPTPDRGQDVAMAVHNLLSPVASD